VASKFFLTRSLTLLAVIVTVLGVVALAGGSDPVQAAPAQQAPVCTWSSIANSTINTFHTSTAYDPDNHKMYIYGGVDKDYAASGKVEVLDLSGAALSNARQSALSAGGTLDLVGAAGAFRGGKGDLSAAYFLGGLQDPTSGQAGDAVQRYVPKTDTWSRPSVGNAAEFRARFFASAAYDPGHDVIWVVGGVVNCALTDVMTGGTCNARSLPTQYLTFDATTGDPTWHTLAGGDQSFYGTSMVYDEVGKRMVIYGGTGNISSGDNRLLQLDLTDADVTKASFKSLAATGSPPQVFFHGAAYDSVNKWMVSYGGVTRNFLKSNEAVNSDTWVLDLGATSPAWRNLRPNGDPKNRVGTVMGYSAKHSAVILALGRDKTKQTISATPPTPEPIESETVQRSSYAMVCVVPTATTPRPTTPVTPGTPGTATRPTPVTPTTPAPLPKEACAYLSGRVPPQAIADALANPSKVAGYGLLCNPNLAPSPYNVERSRLSLQSANKPYHPLYNGLVWSCGCP